MSDLERELRALLRPEPSAELDRRIERLHAAAPRGSSEKSSAARRRALAVVRAAALLLVGWLLGRATAPSGQSAPTSPDPADTRSRSSTQASEITPVVEPRESPRFARGAAEPPLFAATNVRPLLARVSTAPRSTDAPPLFVPPRKARIGQELRPTPLHE